MADLSKLLCAEIVRNLKAGDRPRIPAGGDLLWRWFGDLSRTRAMGFGGLRPITYAEIAAYADLHRLPIEPHHVVILTAMDRVFIEAIDDARPPEGVKVLPPISTRPMSAGLFDAAFGG
jgi:hypothetical protein